MIFSVSFFHADRLIHKSISVLPGFKDPDTDRILRVIDGLQLIVDTTKLLWNIRFDANHCFPLLQVFPTRFTIKMLVRTFRARDGFLNSTAFERRA